MQTVIYVNTQDSCFKYALLSIIHQVIVRHHQRASKYEQWLDDFDFGDIDPSDICNKSDVTKIEKINNPKINIHVWKKE